MYVCPLKNYYFDLIHARQNLDNKTEFLMPDKVNTVENKNYKYISLFFNEEDFGMESYGFGEVLAENEVAIVKTKYRKKTCACKTSGSFFKGYFLVRNNDIQLIETDKKLNILNKKEALHFLDEHTSIDLPQNINTIDELIAFIKNINN
jgi:uncharacterized protein YqkB